MDSTGFTAYLESKGLAPATIAHYAKAVALFFKRAKKEDIQITKTDVLRYLEHLKKHTKQQNITRWHACIALKHYFNALQQANMISHNPVALIKMRGTYKKRLYKIYTPDELTELADNFYAVFIQGFDDSYMKYPAKKQKSFLSRQRNYAMLTVLLYQGLTTQELPKINLNDIDLNKARLTLNSGGAVRNLPIRAAQMGTLIHYIKNIRPLFLDFCGETDRLFFSLSVNQYDRTFSKPLRTLTKQVKSIDKNFIDFMQIRASVITRWIQAEGLRKAQYLAGHRYISSTEKYVSNSLDGLIDDINKLHPF